MKIRDLVAICNPFVSSIKILYRESPVLHTLKLLFGFWMILVNLTIFLNESFAYEVHLYLNDLYGFIALQTSLKISQE